MNDVADMCYQMAAPGSFHASREWFVPEKAVETFVEKMMGKPPPEKDPRYRGRACEDPP